MTGKLSLVAGLLIVAGAALAGQISSCQDNIGSPGFTCNIYESDASGNPSDIGNVITLPNSVTAGYVVLLDNASDNTNQANWSDVLVFTSSTVQLYSIGCNIATGNTSCFPTYSTVTGAPNAFILEGAVAPTQYLSSPNTYNIYSDESDEGGGPSHGVPEPATFGMLGAGLAGVFLARKRLTR